MKRLLLIFLVALLIGVFAACGEDRAENNSAYSDTSSESLSESTSESKTETLPQRDLVDTSKLLPTYQGKKKSVDYTDTYNDCILMTVQGTAKADYEAYIAKLSSFSNYQEIVAPRDMLGGTGNIASTYTKSTEQGVYLIHVLWIPEENSIYGLGEVKVTVEPLRNTDLSVFDPASATTGDVDPLIIQIGLDEVTVSGSDANTTGGHMAYAQRLSDGSFFLLDGGGSNLGTSEKDKDCAIRIYETLKKYSPTEEIVIAGWYFSHPHVDHMGGFMAFVERYVNNENYNVKLENVICYLPNVKTQTYVDSGKNYSLSPEKIKTYNECLEGLRASGTSIHKAHVGQMYYLRNLTIEILFTYDMITPKLPDAFFKNNAYIHMREHGVVQNSTGGGVDFTNSFSVIIQATVKVDEDTSYKAIWTGDATCFGIETVNSMYGFAMKSDFVQVPHHGSIQMTNGSESDTLIKNYHQIQVNHFFGSVYNARQDEYTRARFADYFDKDGSYGYVRAKYILWPASIGRQHYFDDVDNAMPDQSIDVFYRSNLNDWNPIKHFQDEARLAGGDCYLARCYLTVFTLGDTVTVTKDRDVIKTPMPDDAVGGAIRTAADLANMDSVGNYYLTDNITITDPEGALCPKDFCGVLDGKGYTITIVYSDLTSTEFLEGGSGFLFVNVNGATIKNLTISGVKMSVGSVSNQFGVLARRATGTVLIENVHVKNATVIEVTNPNANIGGFFGDIGANAAIIIKDSSFEGTINAEHAVGGLLGRIGTSSAAAKSVEIQNCTVSGTLATTGARIGGFVAQVNVSGPCQIKGSECKATVTGSDLAGGFVGQVVAGTVALRDCKLTETPTGSMVRDWVASGSADITNCTKG